MRVPGGSQLIKVGDVMQNSFLTGRTNLTFTRKLQQRFGVRPRTTQQILIPELFGNIGNARLLLDAFALGLLQQVNGLGDGGSMLLDPRPDLELGHNINFTERQKLYYINGIGFTWQRGKDSTTTLNLAYGHDWGEEIPNPWSQVNLADLLTPKPFKRAGTPEQGNTSAGDTLNRSKISPGTSEVWREFIWPVPTLT